MHSCASVSFWGFLQIRCIKMYFSSCNFNVLDKIVSQFLWFFFWKKKTDAFTEAPSRNIIAAVKRVAHQPKLIKPKMLWPGVRPVCTRRGAGAGWNPAFPRLVWAGSRWRQFVHRAASRIKRSFTFHPARSERFDLFLPFSIFTNGRRLCYKAAGSRKKNPSVGGTSCPDRWSGSCQQLEFLPRCWC